MVIYFAKNSYSTDWLSITSSVEKKIEYQFFQEWSENMNSPSKGLCYRIFKKELKIEKYISTILYIGYNFKERSYGPLNQGDSGQYSAYILKN